MAWGRLDDKLHGHRKFVSISLEAAGLWLFCNSWSLDQSTDGVIPLAVIRRFAGVRAKKLAKELVEVSLWLTTEDESSLTMKNFLHYNLSAASIKEKRDSVSEIRSEAGKKGAQKRWHTPSNDAANASETDGKGDGKNMANGWQEDGPVSRIPYPVSDTSPTPSRNGVGESVADATVNGVTDSPEHNPPTPNAESESEGVLPAGAAPRRKPVADAPLRELFAAFKRGKYKGKPPEFYDAIPPGEFSKATAALKRFHADGITPEKLQSAVENIRRLPWFKDDTQVTWPTLERHWTDLNEEPAPAVAAEPPPSRYIEVTDAPMLGFTDISAFNKFRPRTPPVMPRPPIREVV